MPYSAAQLTTIYTNIHAGLAPNAAQTALLNAYAAQNNAGTLSDASTLQAVIDTADADSAVAIASYQFFTGTSPSAAGLAYLVNSAANPNDLNDAYYQNFNQTNRYINFAANLGTGEGAGAASFAAAYGALTFGQAVDIAYETVIGTPNAVAAKIDVAAAKAYITSQLPYFTALATQNFPTATAAQRDLIIKAEMVGYIISAGISANVGTYSNATSALLGDLGPDNVANLGTDLLASYAAGQVTLTSGVDVLTANVFNAPRTFTPGGTDQINSLNDDDVLTGAGTNPTLNFTFVNDADTGDNNIVPTLTNIQTVNIAFAGDASGLVLDAQDSTGIKAVNISRISDSTTLAAVRNLQAVPTTLSVANTNSQATTVEFSFSDAAAAGTADATSLTVSNVQVGKIIVEEAGAGADQGVETITLISAGNANKIGVLQAEDLKSLVITGGQKLTLGATSNLNNANQTEAVRYGAGLANVAGSLTSVAASAMTAGLDIALGSEVIANLEDTSGTPVNFSFKGGAGDDIIRLTKGLDGKGDTIDGGAGTNTVQVFASVSAGSVTNVQKLDVRAGHDLEGGAVTADVINVDTSLFTSLASITLRNEGMDDSGVGGAIIPVAEQATFNLTKLTPATAAAITVLHGTTGNNSVGGTVVTATLATDTASDTVGVTIANGVNTDPRSNFTLTAGNTTTNVVENVTITDSDTESNTVLLTNVAQHTGTITINGGQVGNFLNLDATANATRVDQSGKAADGVGFAQPDDGAAQRLVATTIAAGSFVGNLVVRVGNPTGSTGAQSITTGSGDDTVIFDAISGIGQSTAGLSISDTVAGGEGNDTLVIDGHGALINISASEWTNVSGFETLRLAGQGGGAGNAGALGTNQYNITLTNAFITANGTTTGAIRRIAIVNDNDTANDVVGVVDTVGTGAESGVTIDARQLDATHSFSYNGEEGASRTNDRFIMSDANINGAAIIDGGAVLGGGNSASNLANADILEIRNAAVVTIGDLANVKNVGTLQFTNDTAAVQNSVLQLDDATVDRLVNSTKAAAAGFVETLTIQAIDNPILPAATTSLNIDASAMTSGFLALNVTGGGGADVIKGGAGADIINGGAGRDVLTGGGGADTFVFAAGVADTVAAANSIAGVDHITDLNLGTGLAGGGVDLLDLTAVVANVGTTVTGAVSEATFIADLNTLLNVGGGAGFDTAVAGTITGAIITVNAGDLAGRSFLAVDLDGSDTFTATDFVIEVTGYTGVLDVSDFI